MDGEACQYSRLACFLSWRFWRQPHPEVFPLFIFTSPQLRILDDRRDGRQRPSLAAYEGIVDGFDHSLFLAFSAWILMLSSRVNILGKMVDTSIGLVLRICSVRRQERWSSEAVSCCLLDVFVWFSLKGFVSLQEQIVAVAILPMVVIRLILHRCLVGVHKFRALDIYFLFYENILFLYAKKRNFK